MARFYFHLKDGFGILHDAEGHDLADARAARAFAIDAARDLISRDVREGTVNLFQEILVDDDRGETVARVALIDVVRLFN
jgi:hypothetical protein